MENIKSFILTAILIFGGILSCKAEFPIVDDRFRCEACQLINPPDWSVDWYFYANQGIWVTIKNGNPLGNMATLGHYFAGEWTYYNYLLGPFEETDKIYFSIFGEVPIFWRFNLTSYSSVAALYAVAQFLPF